MSLSYLSAIFKARESLQTKRDQKHRHIAYSIAYCLGSPKVLRRRMSTKCLISNGDPDWIRTSDPQIRNPMGHGVVLSPSRSWAGRQF